MTAAVLMCQPDFFGIEYEINPWMHVAVKVDHALAAEQWGALYQTYVDLGVRSRAGSARLGFARHGLHRKCCGALG